MRTLILINVSPLDMSFAYVYGVRDWLSRRRCEREFYEAPQSQPHAHAGKIEGRTGTTAGNSLSWELHSG
jgi:hypothetical protein